MTIQGDRGGRAAGCSAADFFRIAWPDAAERDGHLNIWTEAGKRSHWFPAVDLDAAGALAERLARRTNVYFGVALVDLEARRAREARVKGIDPADVDTDHVRGTIDTARAIPGAWVDIDVGNLGHKGTKYPPTVDDAMALLRDAIPLEPSIINLTGGGLHGYYLFAEPWTLDTSDERDDAADLIHRIQRTVSEKAKERGWEVDGTGDLARVLRPWGTYNRKKERPEPYLVAPFACDPRRRYQPSDFDPYLLDLEWRQIVAEPVALPTDLSPVNLDALRLPAFLKHVIREGNAWNPTTRAWRYGSRSQAVWRVVNELVERKLGNDVIASLMLDARYGIAENPLSKGPRARAFVAREIGKARTMHADLPSFTVVTPAEPVGGVTPRKQGAEQQVADELERARSLLSALRPRTKADAGFPFEPEIIGALALVKERDAATWARAKADLKACGASIKDVAAKMPGKGGRAHLRVLAPDETQDANPRTAGSMLADAPMPNLIIPDPYFIRDGATGILQVREGEDGATSQVEIVIAHAPLLITGRLRDADDGIEAVNLSWRRNGHWRNTITDRGTALDSRKLVALADMGAPVTSQNARDVVTYLDKLESINFVQLPTARVTSHLGYQGANGEHGFLIGRTLILPDGELRDGVNLAEIAPEDWREDWVSYRGAAGGDEQIADAFGTEGTMDGWLRAIAPLGGFPRAQFGFYSSFSAPLLQIVKAPNFIIDKAGRTSIGKTSLTRIEASVWGNPDERSPASAIISWDNTIVFLERYAANLNGITMFADDTKRAKDPKTVAAMLYAVANGRGRGRGNPRGLARTRAWRTVLSSTGEAPATSFTQDGGTRMRVLALRGFPFGPVTDENRRTIDLMTLGVMANYGHAGRAFMRWLYRHRDDWPKMAEAYRRNVETLMAMAKSAESGRLAQYVATVALTASLVHQALDLPWAYGDPISLLWDELAAEASDAAGDLRALRDAVSWSHAHEQSFYGRHDCDRDGNPRVPSRGWSGRWDNTADWEFIGFLPTALNAALKDLGYEPAAILGGWRERGWLDISSDDRQRFTKRTRVGHEAKHLIVVKRSAVTEVDA